MSKVITFSRTFPAYHPKKGERTYFVEKVLNELGIDYQDDSYLELLYKLNSKRISEEELSMNDLFKFYMDLECDITDKKLHTIRGGNRWKVGDMASFRVWQRKPYNSPQIMFAPEVEIKNIHKFEVDEVGVVSVNNFYCLDGEEATISKNDGLSENDFNEWLVMPCFRKGKTFDGQILCWNDKINYG